ncbi:MAG: TonB-dependent receptor [Alphaproteobacteria bacterium]|nr:TonB-dependent receptor [Alphaproteobacteria bacterium]
MKHSTFMTWGLSGVAGLALLSGVAYAQPTAPTAESDTIIVTARQRAEAIKDVPIAVSAFTAKTIEEAGITRPQDFIALTPNVTFIQTTNVGESQVHIRGVIQPRDTEPPFAYVVDGVLMPNPNAFNQELVDIQQIEVIKGPIGSIYGRNAVGGAILVSTKKPGPDFEGVVNAGYEFEGKEKKVGGYLSGPLGEKVFARITANYTDRDGYFDNITRKTKEDPFSESVLRGRVIWEAAPNVEVDFNANYGKVDGFAFNFNNQFSGTPGFTGGVDTGNTSIPYAGNLKSFNDQERYGLSAKLNWKLDAGTLSAFVAYNKLEESMGGEGAADIALFGLLGPPGPNVPAPSAFFTNAALFEGYGPTDRDGAQYQERNQDDTSFEVRFTSDESKRLRYIVGGYYIDFNRDILLLTGDFGTGNTIREAPRLRVGQAGVNGTGGDNSNSAYAVFGQLAYDVTEKLEVSGALRYDKEDRENTNTVPGVRPIGFKRSTSFDKVQPRVSLRYKATDDATFYATYGEGFRSGGFNALGSRNAIITVDGVTGTTVQDFFPEESSKSFEVGGKFSLLDGRVSLNAAAFQTKVDNAQFFQFFPFSLSRVISIVQENEIKGAEFDLNAKLTDNVTVFAGGGVLESKIKQNRELPRTVGNKFPFTPDHSLLLGAQYRREVATGTDFLARIEYTQTGKMYFDTENTRGTARPTLDLVNARIGLEHANWTATLWSRNLTDEKYNSDAVVLNVPPSSTFNFVTKGVPRTVGIEIGYRF